jgi:EmrB/QacA subfamily drug resistance transporter
MNSSLNTLPPCSTGGSFFYVCFKKLEISLAVLHKRNREVIKLEEVMGKNLLQHVKKGDKRPIILAAVMLAMFMGAVEATIVSTAMPAIVGDLGGFSLYSWVFSGYLLMNSVTVLIYGKLSDLFGRKPVLTFGIIVFLVGSILCGFAGTMNQLIVYRFIQGLGAGAVMPVAMTIVGDIYSKEERAQIQGYLSSVWGISAIIGPALGGLFVEHISWRLVFWVNIPLGILAIILLWLFLNETVEKRKHSIDYFGSILLTVGISSFMLILVEGGVHWAWTSFPILSLSTLSILCFLLFVVVERKASEPIMPFEIWRNRSISIANIVSLTTGMMLIGISSFLPAFVQGVMGKSPTVAGFTLTTMSIGWPIAAALSGKWLLKIGYRNTSLLGGLFLIFGSMFFVFMSENSGPFYAATGSFFVGAGMGLSSTAFIVLIQSTVSWQQRGIATASNSFMRNMGNTIGAALLGGILNTRLNSYFRGKDLEGGTLSIDSANMLLDESQRNNLPENVLTVLKNGLTLSLHSVYWVVITLAIISLLLIYFLPKEKE